MTDFSEVEIELRKRCNVIGVKVSEEHGFQALQWKTAYSAPLRVHLEAKLLILKWWGV